MLDSQNKTCRGVFLVYGSTCGNITGTISSTTSTESTSVNGRLGPRRAVWPYQTSTILHGTYHLCICDLLPSDALGAEANSPEWMRCYAIARSAYKQSVSWPGNHTMRY